MFGIVFFANSQFAISDWTRRGLFFSRPINTESGPLHNCIFRRDKVDRQKRGKSMSNSLFRPVAQQHQRSKESKLKNEHIRYPLLFNFAWYWARNDFADRPAHEYRLNRLPKAASRCPIPNRTIKKKRVSYMFVF